MIKNKIKSKSSKKLLSKRIIVKTIIFGIICLAVFIIAITSNIVGRSYTSDEVAEQGMAYDLTLSGPHNIYLESDTYVSKIAFYSALDLFSHPGRNQLIIESLTFNFLMLILLVICWRYLFPKNSKSWLVFLWLISVGVYWMSITVNPNSRNYELGVMLLFGIFVIKKLEVPYYNLKQSILYILGCGIIGGIITYDDPYFLFFFSIPIILAVLIYNLPKRIFQPVIAAGTALVLSMVTYEVISEIFAHFGMAVSNFNEITGLSTSIIYPNFLPTRLSQVANAYLSTMGANPSRIHTDFWLLPVVILNLAIVCLAIYGLFNIIYKRRFTLINIWILITFIVALSYVTATRYVIEDTTRYLIILIPLTAYLSFVTITQLARYKKSYYKLALVFVVLAIILNIVQGFAFINQNKQIKSPNQLDYQVIKFLSENHIAKVYANYWVANISYYLSDYK